MPSKQSLESPESSSPIVTRAVAAGLQGTTCENYLLPGWQKALLLGLGALPQGIGRGVVSRFQALGGLEPELVEGITTEGLAEARLQDYAGLPGRFPVVVAGAALGGAAAHLALVLGGPFLPVAFVTSLRGGSMRGDVQEYFKRSAGLAKRIAERNPGLLTIQHFDPVHDAWLTRFVNHLRYKLIHLPEAYRRFLRQRLEPGGTVVYLDSQASWLRYRVGERSVFQVGGWGDISAQEFLEGSLRLENYRRQAGFRTGSWALAGYVLEAGPESEWGCEPELGVALEEFCRQEGYRFISIPLGEPHDASRLAFAAARRLLEKEGREPAGVVVEMFSQFDAWAARAAGLLPLWLVFNTLDSLEFMKNMRPQFPPARPVFFSALATFTLTPDIAPWDKWKQALNGLDVRLAGARPSHYPADTRALVRWAEPLRTWVAQNYHPIQAHITPDELLELAAPEPERSPGR